MKQNLNLALLISSSSMSGALAVALFSNTNKILVGLLVLEVVMTMIFYYRISSYLNR